LQEITKARAIASAWLDCDEHGQPRVAKPLGTKLLVRYIAHLENTIAMPESERPCPTDT